MNLENLKQDLKQLKAKNTRNARESGMFCCPSTPAPTPPGSKVMIWNTGVGAGLLDSRSEVGAGERVVREEKKKDERKQRGKPPMWSLLGLAGFSTPFPEGVVPFGDLYFLTSIKRSRP